MLEIRTLGGLQLASGGTPITDLASRKAEALLVYLVVTGRPQPRELLADFFWDERTQTQAMANLRTVLSSLRKNLGEYLEISRDYAAMRPGADVWLDLTEFEKRLGAAKLNEAISLYQGEFLEGFHIRASAGFEDWLVLERERCLQRLQDGLHTWVRYHIERGSYREGIGLAEQLLIIDPLDEEAISQLMILLALSGKKTTALKRYVEFCSVLKYELNVEPTLKTQETYKRISNDSLALENILPSNRVRVPQDVGKCPYRGLASFREIDAPFFFGREDFTDQLEHAINDQSIVNVLIGPSGSGKSSAVFAGLFPRLRKAGGWRIISTRPGREPIKKLAAAIIGHEKPEISPARSQKEIKSLSFRLRHEPGSLRKELHLLLERNGAYKENCLLLVDQFEELYTLCKNPESQNRYLNELLSINKEGFTEKNRNNLLLLILRADFMGHALSYRPFADVLQNSALVLGPMNRRELRSAILKPAEKQGAAFEPGLVERILDDIGDEPGNLPLLEFTLTLLWDRLDQGWITHSAYEEIGQASGALTRYAEEVFNQLDADQQSHAERIFKQLVQPGDRTEDTRRVTIDEELAGIEWSLIQHLADKRLVVTGVDQEGNKTVEVVHETLIQNWGRLKSWMDQDRTFRVWQEELRTAVKHWEFNQKDEGDLLRGRSLNLAESWIEERSGDLSNSEKEFIWASIDLRNRRIKEKIRRRRSLIIGLTASFLITLALSIFSVIQRNNALAAYSVSLAAHVQNALDENRIDTALALALAANDIPDPPEEALRVLRQAAFSPGPTQKIAISEMLGNEGHVYSLEASPTDMTVLLGMEDGNVYLWDIEANAMIHQLIGHTDIVQDLAFSDDGKLAASASHDGLVIIWDLVAGEEYRRFTGHSGWVRAVDFSPDGSTIISGGYSGASEEAILNPGELILWNAKTGEVLQWFEGHQSGVVSVAFRPDGKSILASSGLFIDILNPFSLFMWDIETGILIHDFEVEHDNLNLAISPDGRTAISGDNLFSVHLWDLETGTHIQSLGGHEGMVRSVFFSPNGHTALTCDSSGTTILWDTSTWEPKFKGRVHEAGGQGWSRFVPMVNAVILPDNRTAISTSEDKSLVTWDLVGAIEAQRFNGHSSLVHSTAFTPDGKYVLTGSGDISSWAGIPGENNQLILWDIASGNLVHTFEGHMNVVMAIAVSADGSRAIAGDADGMVILWDLQNRKELQRFFAHSSGVFAVAISTDGTLGLTGSVGENVFPDDGMALWDLESGEQLRHLSTHSNQTALAFSEDTKSAFVQHDGLTQFELETGERLQTIGYFDTCCTDFVFQPNGEFVYTVTNKTTIIYEWDMETLELIREIGKAHGGIRTRLGITPDGKRLFSSSFGGMLYLWDLETGRELYRMNSGEMIMDIDVSPDGLFGISPGANNTAILWNLSLPVEVDDVKAWISENRYVRELSCEERAVYSIEPLCEIESP